MTAKSDQELLVALFPENFPFTEVFIAGNGGINNSDKNSVASLLPGDEIGRRSLLRLKLSRGGGGPVLRVFHSLQQVIRCFLY